MARLTGLKMRMGLAKLELTVRPEMGSRGGRAEGVSGGDGAGAGAGSKAGVASRGGRAEGVSGGDGAGAGSRTPGLKGRARGRGWSWGCGAGQADRERCVVIRVLLADDQALIRAGFRALLEAAADLEVAGDAVDGQQAVELARRERCRRGPDGHPDAGRGRAGGRPAGSPADENLAGVKVIILTTFESDEYVFQAIRSGVSGFLVKDTEAAELLQAVRVVARGDALLSPSVTRRLITDLASRPAGPAPAAGRARPH